MPELKQSHYLNKISSAKDIDKITELFREFLKNALNMKYEYTYDEISDIVSRKRIIDEAKKTIIHLSERFASLEYRPSKPNKKEIQEMKKELRSLVRISLEKDKVRKKTGLSKVVDSLKKTRNKEKKLKEKAEQENILKTKKILDKVNDDISRPRLDKEYYQICRYISTSLQIGMKIDEIKKELSNMGFHKSKVEFAIKEVKKNKDLYL